MKLYSQAHKSVRSPRHIRPKPAIAAGYMAMAMLLGGGGNSAPVSELSLELVAAVAAAAWLTICLRRGFAALPHDRLALAIAGLALVLPVLQLIPLPPAVWQMLPGRETEVEALKLVGGDNGWMPWSMTPSRTFAALLAIVPPVLALVMVASLDYRGRRLVIATIAALAVASLLLGALQLTGGATGAWRPYGLENQGYLNGFQANRNASADILLIGIIAIAAVLTSYRRELGESMTALCLVLALVLLALGCVATGSRTGVALLSVSILAMAVLWLRQHKGFRTWLWGGALVLIGALGSVTLYYTNSRVAHVMDRFAFTHDQREQIWADTLFAISHYWPFGSGLGSFRPIFFANERLEFVGMYYPNAAHNDYLELALEGGAVALGLLAAITVIIVWMIYRALRGASGSGKGQTVFATSALIIIASHSVVDYPLRSMAIACIAGASVGLLSALPKVHKQKGVPAA